MANIDFDKKQVFEVLYRSGISKLYHANTVATSISFLKNDTLITRKKAIDNDILQTSQLSDAKDRKFEIDDFIFLDTLDNSGVFSRRNEYGPVLFIFNTNIILDEEIDSIRITKINPIKWRTDNALGDQYITQLDAYERVINSNNNFSIANSHIMLKCNNSNIKISKYVKEISIDDPQLFIPDKNSLINIVIERLYASCKGKIRQELFTSRTRTLNIVNAYRKLEKNNNEEFKKLFSYKGS